MRWLCGCGARNAVGRCAARVPRCGLLAPYAAVAEPVHPGDGSAAMAEGGGVTWVCAACGSAWAPGAPCCPACRSVKHEEEDGMAKSTLGGPSWEEGREPDGVAPSGAGAPGTRNARAGGRPRGPG